MWLDGLYMGETLVQNTHLLLRTVKILMILPLQFELIQKHLLDKKTGLLYHGWDESKMDWANKANRNLA